MPVDTKCPAYAAMLPKWERCRIATDGQDAVHAAGERFLPKLHGQEPQEYQAYKKRALYYNAAGRTLEGLVGMIFRKEPEVTLPAALEPLLEDTDLAGTPVDTFIEQVATEILTVSRVGILVDYPTNDPGPLTIGQAQAAGVRPFLAIYRAEAIINWRTARVNGSDRLQLVVLAETYTEREDEFSDIEKPQWRVLDLDEDGRYRVRIYQEGSAEPVQTLYPMKAGRPFDFIPFVIVGRKGQQVEPDKPVLLDLVDVNLSHYRGTADYEHALHFTALPTAVVTGHELARGEVLKIGSSEAWVFVESEADAKYLEFSGQGLEAIKASLDEKVSMMATLGARMLAPEKREAEAAETAAIHRAGENSVLGSIAKGIGRALEQAFQWAAEWAGAGGEVEVQLNSEFLPSGMTAQELKELVAAWQAGAISSETFFDNLVRGGVIADGVTFDEERARIEAAGPTLGIMGGQGGQPANGAV